MPVTRRVLPTGGRGSALALAAALALLATLASRTLYGDPDGLEWVLRLGGCVLVAAAAGLSAVRTATVVPGELRAAAAAVADLAEAAGWSTGDCGRTCRTRAS